MNSASGVFRYLASCYRENGSRSGVASLESGRVRRSIVLEDRDAVVSESVFEGRLFVPGKRAATLATQARLYEKDRELFYGAIFLVGRIEGDESRRPAYAPLILYRVDVEGVTAESGAEFAIDMSRRILNYALLEAIGDSEFVAGVEDVFGEEGHLESCVTALGERIAEAIPQLDRSLLESHPILQEERALKRALADSEEDGTLRLVSAAVLFLADKSAEMRGVLNDLEEMAETGEALSPPVAALLGLPSGTDDARSRGGFRGRIPAVLSAAQERVVESSHESPITLAVGPPGTGKSFTIAALAIEAMSRGESVLVCSKMDHAVDVVADKIESSLGLAGACVRAGRRDYLRQLKSFLENLLSGLLTEGETSSRAVRESERSLEKLRRFIEKSEAALESRCRTERKRGEVLSNPDPGFFTRWRQRRYRRKAPDEPLTASLADGVTRRIDDRIVRIREHLGIVRRYFLHRSLQRDRRTFQSFSRGIRARSSHKKEEYFSSVDWGTLLHALPIWLVNLGDLHRVIPMRRELFDLVIIDEASQCDIASALPALARARRVVITGDPKQLRHVSFLPAARQRELAERNGLTEAQAERLDFRDVSLVDLASDSIRDQRRIVFLDEHFRSRPEIIAFSNAEFYSDRLAVMTGHREIDRHGGAPFTLHRVDGVRGSDGVNEAEVDFVFEQLDAIAARSGPPLSVGILSPFRAQVEAIQKRLERSDDALALLERHDLLVGTSYSFQGEERDVMLLSFALDDASPSASFHYLEKDDVFNVAITRARLENRILVSFREHGRGLVSRFLDHAGRFSDAGPDRVGPETRQGRVAAPGTEVGRALAGEEYEVREGFEVGGYTLDLLVSRGERSLGVDLIGFPGRFAEAMRLERHLAFRRAGIPLFPLSRLEWEERREEVGREIERWLDRPEFSSG